MKWVEQLDRLPKTAVAAAAIAAVLTIAAFDYAMKTDVSLAAFYLVPVSAAALALGVRFSIFISCLSVAGWAIGGVLVGDEDFALGAFIFWWNAAVQLAVYLLVVWALTSLRALRRNLEARVAERAAVLTAEIAERERLQGELLAIGEREQRRLGEDLHDGLCQHLAGTALAAQVLSETLASGGAREAGEAEHVVDLIEQAIALSHEVARGLHPVEADPEGLMHALRQFADATSKLYRVQCRFDCPRPVLVADHGAAEHLFRIGQEATRNALKHGHAGVIVIRLAAPGGRLSLTVEDDGVGFAGTIPDRAGMGLRIMAHRSRGIGAAFDIRPRRIGGTIVSLVLGSSGQAGNRGVERAAV